MTSNCLKIRDLEVEIAKFEEICAELTNIKQDFEKTKQTLVPKEINESVKKTPKVKKEKPKVPPKPKINLRKTNQLLMTEETPEGTEV